MDEILLDLLDGLWNSCWNGNFDSLIPGVLPRWKSQRFFFQNFFPHQTCWYRKIGFGGSYLSQWWKLLDVWNPQLSYEKDPVGWVIYGIILPSDIGSIINQYNLGSLSPNHNYYTTQLSSWLLFAIGYDPISTNQIFAMVLRRWSSIEAAWIPAQTKYWLGW